MTDNMYIQFQGFHPSESTVSHLDLKFVELCTEAPHGSTLRALVQRKNKLLSASVRVFSPAGHFFTTAQGRDVSELSHRLIRRLRRQFKRWKDLRLQKAKPGELYELDLA